MDYTSTGLIFRLKKVFRYVKLYGFSRTWIKVQGQYHMKRHFDALPTQKASLPPGGHVGLIGCGNFGFSNIAYYLNKNYGKVLRGAMDINTHRAASLFQHYGLGYYTDDADQIIQDPEIDLIYIASNHASHAEYAIQALKMGKKVHIEKPHVVNEDQLRRLCLAMMETGTKVGLGFNRPKSKIGKTIKKYLDSQSGAAMFNWFIAGHEIPADHWYFKPEEGGRVLGNLCHWTDFVFQLVAPEHRYPLTIRPSRALQSDCDIAVTFTFGNGTIAAITFSAKGHTFEGVRERFAAHRGNVLISMDDFKDLTVEIVDRKLKFSPFFRDHGHELNVCHSYELVRPRAESANDGCDVAYVFESGNLFLKTREALEQNRIISINAFNPSLHLQSGGSEFSASSELEGRSTECGAQLGGS